MAGSREPVAAYRQDPDLSIWLPEICGGCERITLTAAFVKMYDFAGIIGFLSDLVNEPAVKG
jgi:hypothetical protein